MSTPELMFISTAVIAHPNLQQIAHGLSHVPITQGNYLFLLAVNVSAVIIFWMIFYGHFAIDVEIMNALLLPIESK